MFIIIPDNKYNVELIDKKKDNKYLAVHSRFEVKLSIITDLLGEKSSEKYNREQWNIKNNAFFFFKIYHISTYHLLQLKNEQQVRN